jgi:3-deoxy-D-manno-octulosonate 8-phosphate phosphatase (KDO 8-P phosphatase)
MVLDVDGTLTDGALYFGADGEVLKVFHVRDGHGVKLLQAAGITVAVISGRRHAAVVKRCRDLGIRHVIQGAEDKSRALDALLAKLGLDESEVACIGDDTPDIVLFSRVALGIAVADAHPLAIAAAHAVTTQPGGRGAVREACDWLLDARNRA